MTTIALAPDDTGSERPAASGLVSSFKEFCEGARDGQAIEARYRKLSRMSKADLAEIGLTRAEIYRAALLGRPV
jgi:uncharacterized protein YjiS (DUF1127 family)